MGGTEFHQVNRVAWEVTAARYELDDGHPGLGTGSRRSPHAGGSSTSYLLVVDEQTMNPRLRPAISLDLCPDRRRRSLGLS